MPETYLPQAEYDASVATLVRFRELLNIAPSVATDTITEDEIKIALGERLNVWPECIRRFS
jgi:hypothetical protein